jgi:hypothetical protein
MPIEPMPEEPQPDLIGFILWLIVAVLGCIIAAQIILHMIQKWAQ